MINGLGVLGWGVGGIEAEAAMLGQPVSMLIPQVVGFKLTGKLPEGATATDLVLTITEMLRKEGVVGKFVEFYGPGLHDLPLADRATIANMAPEYGATCGIFPSTRKRCATCASAGAARSRSRWSRPTARSRACSTRRTPEPDTRTTWTRSGDGGTEPGRAQAAAGPRAAGKVREEFRQALPTLLRPGSKVATNKSGRCEGEGGSTAVGVEDTNAVGRQAGDGGPAQGAAARPW